MNRAERRRQKRAAEKEPVLCLKQSDVREAVDEVARSRTREIEDKALKNIMLIVAHSLHKLHGFGKKRLIEFLNEINLQFDCIRTGHVSMNDIKKDLYDKYKIKVGVESARHSKTGDNGRKEGTRH